MIIQTEVEIRIGNKDQFEHYLNKGYSIEWGKTQSVLVSDLMLKSNVKLDVKCDVCGYMKKLMYSKYTINTKNLTTDYFCSNKCAINKQEQTCLKKYGFKYVAQNPLVFRKFLDTCKSRHGEEHFSRTSQYKEKYRNTCLKKYGVESSNQSEIVKEKIKSTMNLKYGVDHALQNPIIFSKQQKTSLEILQYKDTDLTYQGSYEKYFLELLEYRQMLQNVSNGKIYTYEFTGKKRTYYSDFCVNDTTIEIKSSWTYNRNGKDLNLQMKNETRWKRVRELGDSIVILKSKEEINNYVYSLDIINKKDNYERNV